MKWCFIGLNKNYTTNKKYLGGYWYRYGWVGEYDEGLSDDYHSICKYSWKEIKTDFDKPIFPFVYEGIYSVHILVPSFIAFILLLKGTIKESIAYHKYIKHHCEDE